MAKVSAEITGEIQSIDQSISRLGVKFDEVNSRFAAFASTLQNLSSSLDAMANSRFFSAMQGIGGQIVPGNIAQYGIPAKNPAMVAYETKVASMVNAAMTSAGGVAHQQIVAQMVAAKPAPVAATAAAGGGSGSGGGDDSAASGRRARTTTTSGKKSTKKGKKPDAVGEADLAPVFHPDSGAKIVDERDVSELTVGELVAAREDLQAKIQERLARLRRKHPKTYHLAQVAISKGQSIESFPEAIRQTELAKEVEAERSITEELKNRLVGSPGALGGPLERPLEATMDRTSMVQERKTSREISNQISKRIELARKTLLKFVKDDDLVRGQMDEMLKVTNRKYLLTMSDEQLRERTKKIADLSEITDEEERESLFRDAKRLQESYQRQAEYSGILSQEQATKRSQATAQAMAASGPGELLGFLDVAQREERHRRLLFHKHAIGFAAETGGQVPLTPQEALEKYGDSLPEESAAFKNIEADVKAATEAIVEMNKKSNFDKVAYDATRWSNAILAARRELEKINKEIEDLQSAQLAAIKSGNEADILRAGLALKAAEQKRTGIEGVESSLAQDMQQRGDQVPSASSDIGVGGGGGMFGTVLSMLFGKYAKMTPAAIAATVAYQAGKVAFRPMMDFQGGGQMDTNILMASLLTGRGTESESRAIRKEMGLGSRYGVIPSDALRSMEIFARATGNRGGGALSAAYAARYGLDPGKTAETISGLERLGYLTNAQSTSALAQMDFANMQAGPRETLSRAVGGLFGVLTGAGSGSPYKLKGPRVPDSSLYSSPTMLNYIAGAYGASRYAENPAMMGSFIQSSSGLIAQMQQGTGLPMGPGAQAGILGAMTAFGKSAFPGVVSPEMLASFTQGALGSIYTPTGPTEEAIRVNSLRKIVKGLSSDEAAKLESEMSGLGLGGLNIMKSGTDARSLLEAIPNIEDESLRAKLAANIQDVIKQMGGYESEATKRYFAENRGLGPAQGIKTLRAIQAGVPGAAESVGLTPAFEETAGALLTPTGTAYKRKVDAEQNLLDVENLLGRVVTTIVGSLENAGTEIGAALAAFINSQPDQ